MSQAQEAPARGWYRNLYRLSALGGLALGGTVYPPIFYAIGVHGRHLPFYLKAIAAVLALAGVAGECYLLFVV